MLRRGYEFTAGYRLQAYLGKGQFGEVWRASGPGGTKWAVKFVGLEDGRGKKEYEAIKRIKSIRHANLMPITAIWQLDRDGNLIEDAPEVEQTMDLGELDSRGQSGFVVSPTTEPAQLIVGMTLGDASLEKFLPENKRAPDQRVRIPIGELLKYMEGTARGLDFLNSPVHNLGNGPVSLQHCDVKPANIVVVGDSAVLCDFGLARILSGNQVQVTNASGTPAYMSPESIDSNPSRTSDQYSLAVTYYHLRTGILPMDDKTVHSVLRAHMSGELNFDAVSSAEQAVLRRATHLDWRNRFESNSHFVSALRDVLREQGVDVSGHTDHHTTPRPNTPPTSNLTRLGPVGPAVRGVDEMEQEGLTGEIIQRSKGGSPILSRRGDGSLVESRETWMPEPTTPSSTPESGRSDSPQGLESELLGEIRPAVETSDIRLAREVAAGRANSDGSRASVPDAFQFDSGSSKPTGAAARSRAMPILSSVVVAVLLVSGTAWWWPRSGETQKDTSNGGSGVEIYPPIIPPIQIPTIAEAKSKLDDDLSKAVSLFASIVANDSNARDVTVNIAGAHADAIEKILSIGGRGRCITTGYDAAPQLWSWPSDAAATPSTLPRHVDLQTLEEPVFFSEAFNIGGPQKRLSIGAGKFFGCWPTKPLADLPLDQFPIQPESRRTFDSKIFAIAPHPQSDGLVVVALEESRLVVIDTNATDPAGSDQSNAKIIASTETVDHVKSLRFTSDGSTLLIHFEYGDLVAMRWNELIDNGSNSQAVETFTINVNDCQTVVVSDDGPADSFWVGHESGSVTQHRIDDRSSMSVSVLHTFDAIALEPITKINLLPRSGQTDQRLLTASTDGSIAICIASDPPTSMVFPLETGQVRCLTTSQDGEWFAAGVRGGVWVGHVDQSNLSKTFIPIGNVSAENLCIHPTAKLMLVGCSDGTLAWFDWDHARLTSLLPSKSERSAKPTKSPSLKNPKISET